HDAVPLQHEPAARIARCLQQRQRAVRIFGNRVHELELGKRRLYADLDAARVALGCDAGCVAGPRVQSNGWAWWRGQGRWWWRRRNCRGLRWFLRSAAAVATAAGDQESESQREQHP